MRDNSTGKFLKDKTIGKRLCSNCNSGSWIDKHGYEKWRINPKNGLWLCKKCFSALISDPIRIKERKGRRISFLGKPYLLEKDSRKKKCSVCSRSDKPTHRHHWFYLIIMPWACTMELCISCHTKETWKQGVYTNKTNKNREPKTGRYLPST